MTNDSIPKSVIAVENVIERAYLLEVVELKINKVEPV